MMSPIISDLDKLTAHLAARGQRRRVAVVCGTDVDTLKAVADATAGGYAHAIFVGRVAETRQAAEGLMDLSQADFVDAADDTDAARKAVALVRNGEADVLMKGLVGSDVYLRAVLDKTAGLLPLGGVLTHVSVTEWADYGKLLLFSDAAVIPFPTPEQRRAQVGYAVERCRALGVEEPRVALIHCSEKASERFPYTLDYADIIAEGQQGRWGKVRIDGPLDLRTSCDAEALRTKGISSPLEGQADVLIFPNIEAANTFYKTMTFIVGAVSAGVLCGTTRPVVLPSRGDDAATKLYSLAMALL
ncbi:MAG: phosphate acyltransferase [Bacteroidales bacterium]|nr:phosphate acyltransferase [Bacteroidales bacterium]